MVTVRGIVAAVPACGLIGLDLALFVSFSAGRLDWPSAIEAHLALCVAAALLSPGRGRSDEWPTKRLQLAAWMTLLGPFGVLIGLMLFLPQAPAGAEPDPQRPGTPKDDAGSAPDRLEMLCNDLLDGRLRLGGGHSIRPLLDVVIEGETNEKLDALGLVAKRYVPGFAPVLRRALQDEDCSVRVLAATVMAKLHNVHTRGIGSLQDEVQAAPSPELWRALGTARLTYAASGLLDADQAEREAEKGRDCLTRLGASRHAQPLDPVQEDNAAGSRLVAVVGGDLP